MDITKIPIEELKEDLAGAKLDLKAYEKLYAVSRDSRMVEKVETNRAVVQIIEQELKRRAHE